HKDGIDKLVIGFGEEDFEITEIAPSRLDQILFARQCFFRGVSFTKFSITLKVRSVPLDFALSFANGFEIGVLWCHVNNETELDNSMKCIDHFPRSKYIFIIMFEIAMDKLMALPPSEELQMTFRIPLNSDQLLQLISLHKLVRCYHACVTINWTELKQAMEVV
ncbi:hypothetical protein PMAYCL1PPCAC_32130, partial [Pristionchus mayeri]